MDGRESRAKTPHDVANTPANNGSRKMKPHVQSHRRRSAPHHANARPTTDSRLARVRPARRLGSAEGAPSRLGNSRRKCWLAGCREDHGVSRAYQKIPLQQINPHTTTTTMKAPSTALLRTFSPLWRSEAPLATVRGCLAQQQQQRADFSSTPANQARDKRNKKDPRISMPACMELLQLQPKMKAAS
jgi:hypothetical protein